MASFSFFFPLHSHPTLTHRNKIAMVNVQSELMLKAQALMKQKDELEAEIKSQQDDLQSVHQPHATHSIFISRARLCFFAKLH